jgi:hypothetical protein
MSDPEAIRNHYAKHGVKHYYQTQGADYRNPHESIIRHLLQQVVPRWDLDLSHVLDLAAGRGEVTLALQEIGVEQIDAIDPYTHTAYTTRIGRPCEQLTFEDIAQGALKARRYSLIVCSFAMHLVAVSWLPALCVQLRQITPQLLILTPHKRPEIKPAWGWHLHEEVLHERVRARLYL